VTRGVRFFSAAVCVHFFSTAVCVHFLPTAARKVRKEKPLKEEGGLAVQKAASRILNSLQHLPLFKNSPPLPFGRIQNPMLTAEAPNCQWGFLSL